MINVSASPRPPTLRDANSTTILQRLRSALLTGLHRWQSLQVSYRGGKYSVERALCFDEYIRNTSFVRVILVVSGTLVPMCILVISQESIPLNDPRKGWQSNYGFWMRVGILAGVVSNTIVSQVKTIVKIASPTGRQKVVLFTCVSLTYTFVSMGISALVGFPVPFFALSTIPIFFLLLVIWFVVIVGRRTIHEMSLQPSEMKAFFHYICAQMLMPAVYPAYEMIFSVASETKYELPVILLLPVSKIVLKYFVTLATTQIEDMMPAAVILTVDFFHAVYLTTCMQSAKSTGTAMIIVLVDSSQSLAMLFGLQQRTRTVLLQVRRAAGVAGDNESLVALLRIMCQNADKFGQQNFDNVRMHSCLPHPLSGPNYELLKRLEIIQRSCLSSPSILSSNSFVRVSPPKRRILVLGSAFGLVNRDIHPFRISIPSQESSARESQPAQRKLSREYSLLLRQSNIFRNGLETLFTCECLVLASYLHTGIAMFYANFVMIMVHLPSAKYHTELQGVTAENVIDKVQSVFVFGILEMISFGLLAVLMRQKCGIPAFYQLAFVMETQMTLIQHKVMMWMLIILAFRVVHFGMDFTLKFTWMSHEGCCE